MDTINTLHLNSQAVYQPSTGERIQIGTRGVRHIRERHENLGSYGIHWYDAIDANGDKLFSVNALSVATVSYE